MACIVTKLANGGLQQELESNIKWLNCGGCGLFAKFVYEQLASIGVEAVIKWEGNFAGYNLEEYLLESGEDSVVPNDHITVWAKDEEGDWINFDSDGLRSVESHWGNAGHTGIEALDHILEIPEQWNDMFDRGKYEDVLFDIIDNFFEEHKDAENVQSDLVG
jgi:hypothetical protein